MKTITTIIITNNMKKQKSKPATKLQHENKSCKNNNDNNNKQHVKHKTKHENKHEKQ